jgi:hypothetical protein
MHYFIIFKMVFYRITNEIIIVKKNQSNDFQRLSRDKFLIGFMVKNIQKGGIYIIFFIYWILFFNHELQVYSKKNSYESIQVY